MTSDRNGCCPYFFERVASMPPTADWPGPDRLPMCRLLQTLSTSHLWGEVRRLRVVGSMERAGYDARHVDGCGFDDFTQCPAYTGLVGQ